MSRRHFLNGLVATGMLGTLSQTVLAEWPKKAFETENINDAVAALFTEIKEVDETVITITAPEIAENGAVVPVEVETNLPNVESIALIGDKNPKPLIAQFNFPDPENSIAWVKLRIKLGGTSNIVAIVKSNGKLYAVHKEVKVTIGGCGG
ncbi:MAG: thiosulfate oxidation carrier protein SoxY [Thiomargarita sp.]|nr:thiosulfate oxidation carrier protein SoxY [Thiomargarita sp.]